MLWNKYRLESMLWGAWAFFISLVVLRRTAFSPVFGVLGSVILLAVVWSFLGPFVRMDERALHVRQYLRTRTIPLSDIANARMSTPRTIGIYPLGRRMEGQCLTVRFQDDSQLGIIATWTVVPTNALASAARLKHITEVVDVLNRAKSPRIIEL